MAINYTPPNHPAQNHPAPTIAKVEPKPVKKSAEQIHDGLLKSLRAMVAHADASGQRDVPIVVAAKEAIALAEPEPKPEPKTVAHPIVQPAPVTAPVRLPERADERLKGRNAS